MKTWNAKSETVDRKWWVVDATDQTLGRLATQIASVLRGKNKAEFTPHVDTGDFVVVVNANKIKMSGNKWDHKTYYSHSRFFGSLKEMTAKELLEKDSSQVITKAVRGMLPKNRLARQIIKKLKVYDGAEHPHSAQKPQAMSPQA
ncbi:MAG: 50S ribosomal protein L13 [Pseudobdellovibrionaceae bacterium]|nr:50S ribosomal protein L13 [Bdellovibrionales bacterium]USN47184.1 MAG: 50S ribosomal protein L13 [Pseudobdellovibrionaceae bacterium]